MGLAVLFVLFAMVWELNSSSSEAEELSAIVNEKIEIKKRSAQQPPCWYGRCRRRRGAGKRELKVKDLFN